MIVGVSVAIAGGMAVGLTTFLPHPLIKMAIAKKIPDILFIVSPHLLNYILLPLCGAAITHPDLLACLDQAVGGSTPIA